MFDYKEAFMKLQDNWHESVKHYENRIEQLEDALRHCVNAIAEWERNPDGIGPFLLGAMDNARATLEGKNNAQST